MQYRNQNQYISIHRWASRSLCQHPKEIQHIFTIISRVTGLVNENLETKQEHLDHALQNQLVTRSVVSTINDQVGLNNGPIREGIIIFYLEAFHFIFSQCQKAIRSGAIIPPSYAYVSRLGPRLMPKWFSILELHISIFICTFW